MTVICTWPDGGKRADSVTAKAKFTETTVEVLELKSSGTTECNAATNPSPVDYKIVGDALVLSKDNNTLGTIVRKPELAKAFRSRSLRG